MTYNLHGKRTSLENLAGQVTTSAWDCCHKVSETQPNGSTTAWDYDAEWRMIAASRLIPLDMTNVTWLTTCHKYDDLGRQTATWQTNYAAQVYRAEGSQSGVVSQYDYVNDAIGRRTAITRSGSMMSETRTDYYGYNDRNELILAEKNTEVTEHQYSYDDIGNRMYSFDLGTNRTYTANSLNQYIAIDDFVPQFDADGNQTRIKTSTGVWQVTYNGENRPVLWECGATNIVMKFDRMGRRVEYIETVAGTTKTHHRFVYDGYLCIQRLNAASNNAIDLVFGWDPSEPVATRPLVMQKYGKYNLFYTHDGNKNVSELVFFQQANGIAAHYEYAPFGAVTATSRNTPVTAYDFREYNPFRFSSEYVDDTLGLVYYNYRHYNPLEAKWISRDLASESYFANKYSFVNNNIYAIDVLGLAYGNPVSGPNGPVGSGWGPYYPNPWEQPDNTPWYEQIPDCPCSIPLDNAGQPLSSSEGWSNPDRTRHEGGTWEIRSIPQGLFESGQQCVYDSAGKLINEGSGAGTPDKFSPEDLIGYGLHILCDVAPYYLDKWLTGPTEAERLDHASHPPNKGKDESGQPCPKNDGSNNPPPDGRCQCSH